MQVSKKIRLLSMVSSLAVIGGTTVVANLTSCSKEKDNDPSDYVGNEDGSNWHATNLVGNPSINFWDATMTASITMGFESATDLVIPKYVKRNHDQKKFVIQRIGQEAFYNRTLIGSITIPNTIQLIEYNAFFSMDSKNVNGLTFNYETLIGLEYNTYIFDQGNFGTESPNPTVKNLNPKVSNEEMLAFLKTKRLPDKWTAA